MLVLLLMKTETLVSRKMGLNLDENCVGVQERAVEYVKVDENTVKTVRE